MPITDRFRPNGDDPDSSIIEIMFLFARAPDGSHPPGAPMWMLRATRKPGATLARHQESRIRHFRETLDAYMAK